MQFIVLEFVAQLQDINSYNFPRIYYNFLIEDKTSNEIYLFCPRRLRPPRERVRVVSQYLDLTFTKLLQRFPPWNTTRSGREALLITTWTNYDWRVTKMVTPDELSIVNTSVPASAPALFAWGWLLPARKNRRQEKLRGKWHLSWAFDLAPRIYIYENIWIQYLKRSVRLQLNSIYFDLFVTGTEVELKILLFASNKNEMNWVVR